MNESKLIKLAKVICNLRREQRNRALKIINQKQYSQDPTTIEIPKLQHRFNDSFYDAKTNISKALIKQE